MIINTMVQSHNTVDKVYKCTFTKKSPTCNILIQSIFLTNWTYSPNKAWKIKCTKHIGFNNRKYVASLTKQIYS